MKFAVCIKEVLDARLSLQVLPPTGDVVQPGTERITVMNPSDRAALEVALRLRSQSLTGRVEAFSVGGTEQEEALYFALARGANAVERIEPNSQFSGPTYTALLLATRFTGAGFDLICCGDETLDNSSGIVGPLIAEIMDLPQVTAVCGVRECSNRCLLVERSLDRGRRELVELEMPGLVTFKADAAEPLYVSVRRLAQVRQDKIPGRCLDLELARSRLPQWPENTKRVPPRARIKMKFTPDADLPAAERMKLIMAGGMVKQQVDQNSSIVQGDPEYVSEQLYRFLRHHEFV